MCLKTTICSDTSHPSIARPGQAAEFHECHYIATISATRVKRFAAVDPYLEDCGDGTVEGFDAGIRLPACARQQ